MKLKKESCFRLMLVTALLIGGVVVLEPQIAEAPARGEGTEESPYQIESLENLYWIAAGDDVVPDPNQSARWSIHYIQTADIDASETVNWFAGAGWSPIGVHKYWDHPDNLPFTGSYDGQDNTIDALFINRQNSDMIGLFGYALEALLENLRVTNVDITGRNCVGGLVGEQMKDSSLRSSYATGKVFGNRYVGGLVGRQKESTINNSYSAVSVNAAAGIGGMLGFNRNRSAVNNSYSTGNVEGIGDVGGLVGRQTNSIIRDSYSSTIVTGSWHVGGLLGWQLSSTIINSYSKGFVSGRRFFGGLVGLQDDSSTINSYWDTQTSGMMTSSAGEGRTTEQLTYPYDGSTYLGWDFENVWKADEDYSINAGYPYQRQDAPVSVEEDIIAEVPHRLALTNYPNPFNPETTIKFSLEEDTEATVSIYNMRGQLIKTLHNGLLKKGEHRLIWNGRDDNGRYVGSGVYFYRLRTDSYDQVNKMLLIK